MKPEIVIEYERSGAIFEDGKCGFLDVEYENGKKETKKLNFKKKSPQDIVVPLQCGTCRITYRTKSSFMMAANSVMKAINENNGALGAAANAVYEAGGMDGKFDSVVVNVTENFRLVLGCTTDGISKSCRVLSCEQ